MFTQASIVREQQVLKYLGYYNGKIDGIWSIITGQAKIRFERSGKFHPAIPANGQPFRPGVKLPHGLIYLNGLITIPGVDFDTMAEYAPQVVPAPEVDMDDSVDEEEIASVPSQVFDPAVGAVRNLSRKERKKLLRDQRGMPMSETVTHNDGSKSTTSGIFGLAKQDVIDPEELINA